ncbi:MAG: hypothetical protein M3P06_11665 [Acidobacteriota bacterium]|nr:hypothetical protein [Acidobacteriota bacterium]
MTETRDQRIERLLAEAPDMARFIGYGGSSVEHETLVFDMPQPEGETFCGFELRIPVHPEAWLGWDIDAIAAIERAYHCVAITEWNEFDFSEYGR